jgi:hypothetical protein
MLALRSVDLEMYAFWQPCRLLDSDVPVPGHGQSARSVSVVLAPSSRLLARARTQDPESVALAAIELNPLWPPRTASTSPPTQATPGAGADRPRITRGTPGRASVRGGVVDDGLVSTFEVQLPDRPVAGRRRREDVAP